MKRKSLLFEKPHHVAVVERSLPAIDRGEVLVQSRCSAISAGTEMLVYGGRFPDGMTLDAAIAQLRKPFAYPLQYGYSIVGQIRRVGDGVDPRLVGKNVFCFHPHESHFKVSAEAAAVIPPDIAPEAAAFFPSMETAVTLAMDGRPMLGENVAVLGQGVVGLLTAALLARHPVNALLTVDPFEMRRQASETLGAHAALDPGEKDWERRCVDFFSLRGSDGSADLVYELSGNPNAANQALSLCGFASRLVIGSWYGSRPVTLDLGGRFHRRRIRLVDSQVSTIAPEHRGRWKRQRRREVVWEWIRRLNPQRLITHRMPLERAGEAFELLAHAPDRVLQVIFDYDE
jgi:2-desacetyl-2-hydroxyethyl bacteriochlorophyllide A dehydrogenase